MAFAQRAKAQRKRARKNLGFFRLVRRKADKKLKSFFR
jgi:hypothetical protein